MEGFKKQLFTSIFVVDTVNESVMKQNHNFRLVITIIIFAISLFFLENKRKEHRRAIDKASKKISDESNKIKVSNTDYIFFESISKYLFTSLQ